MQKSPRKSLQSKPYIQTPGNMTGGIYFKNHGHPIEQIHVGIVGQKLDKKRPGLKIQPLVLFQVLQIDQGVFEIAP